MAIVGDLRSVHCRSAHFLFAPLASPHASLAASCGLQEAATVFAVPFAILGLRALTERLLLDAALAAAARRASAHVRSSVLFLLPPSLPLF